MGQNGALQPIQLVIITGMSGAGKTVAIQSFEDLGFFVLTTCRRRCCRNFWSSSKSPGIK